MNGRSATGLPIENQTVTTAPPLPPEPLPKEHALAFARAAVNHGMSIVPAHLATAITVWLGDPYLRAGSQRVVDLAGHLYLVTVCRNGDVTVERGRP